LVRVRILEAFVNEPLPNNDGFTYEELVHHYLPRQPESSDLEHKTSLMYLRDSFIETACELNFLFKRFHGIPWHDIQAEDISEIPGLVDLVFSFANNRYYIRARLLWAGRSHSEINMEGTAAYLWSRDSCCVLFDFLATCTVMEREALWLYTKLLAMNGNGILRNAINMFWIDYRLRVQKRPVRIYWNPNEVWSTKAPRKVSVMWPTPEQMAYSVEMGNPYR